MKTITVKELANQVATLLGEAIGIDSIMADSPFPDIENRVRLMAPGILSDLLLELPASELPSSFPITTKLTVEPNGVAKLNLPDDFMRLVSIKFSDWKRAVTEITTDADCLAMQASGIEGIMGSPERPVALIDVDPFGMKQLKLFSTDSEARLEHAFYVPVPKPDSSGSLSYPEILHHRLLERMLKHFHGNKDVSELF